MKRLDQFIEFHRDVMDTLEPDEGHFIRFQEKLNKSTVSSLRWILRIAAVLLVAVFLSINLYIFRSKSDYNLPSELKETAYFYNLRSEKLMFEIRSNDLMDNSEKQVFMKDIRDFEKEYLTILKDLKKFPGDERLVNAFIDYHRSKAEFLEGILNQINGTNLITI